MEVADGDRTGGWLLGQSVEAVGSVVAGSGCRAAVSGVWFPLSLAGDRPRLSLRSARGEERHLPKKARAFAGARPCLWGSDKLTELTKNKLFDSYQSFLLFFFLFLSLPFFFSLPLDSPEIKEEVFRKDDQFLNLLKDVYVESRDPPVRVSVSHLCGLQTQYSPYQEKCSLCIKLLFFSR